MIQEKIFRYFDGNPELHVLFVFDQMGMLQTEIAECTWPADYRIVPFDGQWFTVKYKLTQICHRIRNGDRTYLRMPGEQFVKKDRNRFAQKESRDHNIFRMAGVLCDRVGFLVIIHLIKELAHHFSIS